MEIHICILRLHIIIFLFRIFINHYENTEGMIFLQCNFNYCKNPGNYAFLHTVFNFGTSVVEAPKMRISAQVESDSDGLISLHWKENGEDRGQIVNLTNQPSDGFGGVPIKKTKFIAQIMSEVEHEVLS